MKPVVGVGERQAKWDVVKTKRQEEVWTKDLWAVGCAHRWGACLHVSPQPAPPYLPDEQAVDPSPRKLDEVDVLLLQPRCQRWRGASHHLVNAEDRPLNPRLQGRRAGGEIRRCAMAGMLPCPSMILPLSPSLPPPI